MELQKSFISRLFAISLVFGGVSLWGAAESVNYEQKNNEIMQWIRGLKEGVRFLKEEGQVFTPALQKFESYIEYINRTINLNRGREPESQIYNAVSATFYSAWKTVDELIIDLRVKPRFAEKLTQENANLDSWFDLVQEYRADLKDQLPYLQNIATWRANNRDSLHYLKSIQQTDVRGEQLFFLGNAYLLFKKTSREERNLLTSKIVETVLNNALEVLGSRSDQAIQDQVEDITKNLSNDVENVQHESVALARTRDYYFGELKRLEKASKNLEQSYQVPDMPYGFIGTSPVSEVPEWLEGMEPSEPSPEEIAGFEAARSGKKDKAKAIASQASPLMQSTWSTRTMQYAGANLLSPKSQMKLDYGVRSEQGTRPTMEDEHAHAVSPDGRYEFFGVYDGHAGFQTAKALANGLQGKQGGIITKPFHDMIFNRLATMSHASDQEIAAMLHQAVIDFDKILEANENTETLAPAYQIGVSGSTAIAALIDKQTKSIYFINLGDARGLVARQDGSLANLSRFENGSFSQPQFDATQDHKLKIPEEKAKAEAAGANVWLGRLEGSLAVSRAFGDFAYKGGKLLAAHMRNADIYMKKITPEDRLVIIGCDGIWDFMDSQNAATLVADQFNQGKTADQAVDVLEQHALNDFDQRDNVTSMVIRLQ